MTTKSQMSSATLGSKNEDKTRKRKRPDSLDEDIMDRSKESQSRPGSVQRNRIARTQEDAESTIPTGRLSPSLFPKEDRMDLSKQLQSRRERDHSKKEAQKETEWIGKSCRVELGKYGKGKSGRAELGDNRNYAKDETQMSVDLIKPFQDQALVWVPPPPPDPPNPP